MSTARGVAVTARDLASLVKLSHTVFALPFALFALLTASNGRPSLRLLALVTAAVVCARTAAMAYNRFADRDVDALNPRTAGRELPRGALRPGHALGLAAAAAALFLTCCWLIAPLCLLLGVPVLGWLLLYSHTKRFTAFSHLWLGIALGLSPVAAWFAAEGTFTAGTATAAILGVAVAAWVAGFDVLYACQDEAFDRAHGLRSLPAALGARRAMAAARALHAAAAAAFVLFGVRAGLGAAWFAGVAAAAALLVWQHALLRGRDLSRIHTAFFTANGLLAVCLLAAGCIDLFLLR